MYCTSFSIMSSKRLFSDFKINTQWLFFVQVICIVAMSSIYVELLILFSDPRKAMNNYYWIFSGCHFIFKAYLFPYPLAHQVNIFYSNLRKESYKHTFFLFLCKFILKQTKVTKMIYARHKRKKQQILQYYPWQIQVWLNSLPRGVAGVGLGLKFPPRQDLPCCPTGVWLHTDAVATLMGFTHSRSMVPV